MEIEEEIAKAAAALKEQITSAMEMPAFKSAEWTKDFHVAMGVAGRRTRDLGPDDGLNASFQDLLNTEKELVASAARMADLMQAERKARRATAGTDTTQ